MRKSSGKFYCFIESLVIIDCFRCVDRDLILNQSLMMVPCPPICYHGLSLCDFKFNVSCFRDVFAASFMIV